MKFDQAAHPFPMIRAGGLFVMLIGAGIVVGALLGAAHIVAPLLAGAVAALFSLSVFRRRLTAPLGQPTRRQRRILFLSITLEMLLCGLVAYVLRNAPARVFWLWILVAVGAHFLMLARAQGPLLLVLGLLCIVNAALGLWQASIPFLVCWFIDGALKIITGGWMFWRQPRWRIG
jgi:Ca2+/Na+ antiporter